ncbi:MAG: type II toxin-antitoxin system HicB family antitoxin [Thermoplasmataceae archaeon]|jgi:predicted RNase H-like HicB family nuclease
MGPTAFRNRLGEVKQVEILNKKPYTSNSIIQIMRFTVVLEKDEDGVYVATVPALPGCISDGQTVEEAMSNIKDAIRGFIEDMKADGETIPHDIDIIGNVELNA